MIWMFSGPLQINTTPIKGMSLSNVVQVSPSMTFGGTMTTAQQPSQMSVLGNLIEKKDVRPAGPSNTQGIVMLRGPEL